MQFRSIDISWLQKDYYTGRCIRTTNAVQVWIDSPCKLFPSLERAAEMKNITVINSTLRHINSPLVRFIFPTHHIGLRLWTNLPTEITMQDGLRNVIVLWLFPLTRSNAPDNQRTQLKSDDRDSKMYVEIKAALIFHGRIMHLWSYIPSQEMSKECR